MIAQLTKFNSEGIRGGMMDHFAGQRQCVFAVKQQESELISDLYVGTGGEICHSQTAETDVLRLSDADRLLQALVFDGKGDTRGHIVTRVTSAIVRGDGIVVVRVCH